MAAKMLSFISVHQIAQKEKKYCLLVAPLKGETFSQSASTISVLVSLAQAVILTVPQHAMIWLMPEKLIGLLE